MKFTPGPWKRDGLTIKAENGYCICRVNCPNTRGKEGREDFEYSIGNAKLIASTTDMYEALLMIDNMLSGSSKYEELWANYPDNDPEKTPADIVRAILKQVGE